MIIRLAAVIVAATLLSAAPASAADDRLELWLNPAFTTDIDERTSIELETQQRFRSAPIDDFYAARLWLGRKVADGVTVMIGLHRGREGDTRETRFMQQASYPLVAGFKGRTRLEQRHFNDAPRTAWRIRQRVGASVPLTGNEDGWALVANAEGFFTLRANRAGGDTGLTGLRTFVGFEREFKRVEVEVGYTRQQNIRRGTADTVGHAPTLALTFKL